MKLNITRLIFVLLTSIFFSACIENFVPDVPRYESLLTVNGGISNLAPPYFINLSKSSLIDNASFDPIINAKVAIVDEIGNIETLKELEPGLYASSINGMIGEVGKSYKLTIETTGGIQYESSYEDIRNPLEISDIPSNQIEIVNDLTFEKRKYKQFFLINNFSDVDTNYYTINLEETYKYTAQLDAVFKYVGSIVPVTEPWIYKTCWRTEKIKEFYTLNNHITKIKNVTLPLNVVPFGKKISIRYSLNVIQKSMNRNAFEYFEAINRLISSSTNLYNIQGYQINGNIKRIGDEDNVSALGYFLASGTSIKRAFFDRPSQFAFDQKCIADTEAMRFLPFTDPKNYPVLLAKDGERIGVGFTDCIDCRKAGGKNIKPDFWIE